MGGFFGIVSKKPCVNELYYGTDYHSHLGTRRGGMAAYDGDTHQFVRSIHNLENAYFRNKFAGATAIYNYSVAGDDAHLQLHRNKWRVRMFFGFRF